MDKLKVDVRYKYSLNTMPSGLEAYKVREYKKLKNNSSGLCDVYKFGIYKEYVMFVLENGKDASVENIDFNLFFSNITEVPKIIAPKLEKPLIVGQSYNYTLGTRPFYLLNDIQDIRKRNALEAEYQKTFKVLNIIPIPGSNGYISYQIQFLSSGKIIDIIPDSMNIFIETIFNVELNKQRANLTQRLFSQHGLPTTRASGPLNTVMDMAGIKTPKNRYGGKKRKTRRR